MLALSPHGISDSECVISVVFEENQNLRFIKNFFFVFIIRSKDISQTISTQTDPLPAKKDQETCSHELKAIMVG